MPKRTFFNFFVILIFTLIASCKNEVDLKVNGYNTNANKLIQQIIIDKSCDCVLDIPKESLIEITKKEMPQFDLSSKIIESLNLKDKNELDSLIAISKKFVLDTLSLSKKNILIINRNDLKKTNKDSLLSKKCPKGDIYIYKPIFDKNYKRAIVVCGYTGLCLSQPISIYELKNSKWIKQNEAF